MTFPSLSAPRRCTCRLGFCIKPQSLQIVYTVVPLPLPVKASPSLPLRSWPFPSQVSRIAHYSLEQ